MSAGAPTIGGINRVAAKANPNLAISADNIKVAPITAAEFTFAGGTLQQFCQAIADAIPAE